MDILITAVLVIMGLNVVTSPPMVFSSFRGWLKIKLEYLLYPGSKKKDDALGFNYTTSDKMHGKDMVSYDRAKQVMKPLLTCPVCMSSVWGSVVWFSYGQGITWLWPVFLIKLAGLIYIVMILCYKDPINE